MAVKHYLQPLLEPIFDPGSCGYRPRKSAKEAVAATRKRCWQSDWVVEFDIKGAFDHKLLVKALRHHKVPSWIELYIKRWLTAPFVAPEGTVKDRIRGIPQGGVTSPLLMNLFMHYTFDTWMRRTFASCAFARYADDAVVHCRSKRQAELIFCAIEDRLQACHLTRDCHVRFCKRLPVKFRRSTYQHSGGSLVL